MLIPVTALSLPETIDAASNQIRDWRCACEGTEFAACDASGAALDDVAPHEPAWQDTVCLSCGLITNAETYDSRTGTVAVTGQAVPAQRDTVDDLLAHALPVGGNGHLVLGEDWQSVYWRCQRGILWKDTADEAGVVSGYGLAADMTNPENRRAWTRLARHENEPVHRDEAPQEGQPIQLAPWFDSVYWREGVDLVAAVVELDEDRLLNWSQGCLVAEDPGEFEQLTAIHERLGAYRTATTRCSQCQSRGAQPRRPHCDECHGGA